jgi:thioredoxin-related protein
MGLYCARTNICAAMVAAFLASSSRAEDAPSTPPVEPATAAEAPADDAIAAQTVSTISPVDTSSTLFPHTSYPEAWTAAQKSNRPILLYVTMPGCPHCDQMMAETYHRENIEHLVCDSFESIQVNSKSQPALVKSLKVKWFPTTILVGANNKVMDVIEGYVDAKTFQKRLQTGLASAESSTQTR